ncbi:TonB-dependent receptor [Flavobacterium sp.]|jgi:outer membrane receptor protein involved in Fe transport|uniref:TonB-dependent receptor n=1 Tax=Flavobacterium sp. TaxID=239 RepID=UPI0022C53FDC|nr:TonB-dependent receptor [Flavobacterium sp.]MCZ8228176.1 TonB-dependent receptor [Flavobacterium sp.]
MKIKHQTIILSILLLLTLQLSFAQKKNETIGAEEVNVVKSFSPTVSDAFKIKEIPLLDDKGNAKKETVKYTVLPFPVASTFTPSKGVAAAVEKGKAIKLFENYAALGIGNYGTLQGSLFVYKKLQARDFIGASFQHHSSQGGINDVLLDDHFYDTKLDLFYGVKESDYSWDVAGGFQSQTYNWYGLPADFGISLTPSERNDLINGIAPEQKYNTITLSGNLTMDESLLDESKIKFHHFTDGFGSSENRFFAESIFGMDLWNEAVTTSVVLDYLGGSFENNYAKTNTEAIEYRFLNFGLAPRFAIAENDWTLQIGASLFYSLDAQASKSKLYFYPNFKASYKVVGDLMIFYLGADGSLKQNTYMDFVNENPFLSPTLLIQPTDSKYNLFAGLKGKLANSISYNVSASYLNEGNKALFKANNYTENSANEPYAFGNSLGIVYDDVKTMILFAELKADFSRNVAFGINATLNTYTTDVQAEAWNLPTMKINSALDVVITDKWFAGAKAFFVGERKENQLNTDLVTNSASITLPSYFDVNLNVGYKYSERITAFLRANNIANQAYQKWLNLPVQGFQIVAGASYKFDF